MTTAGTAMLDPEIVFEKLALREGMRLADLGCGRTGHFIFSASRRVGDTGIVYAVDIMKDILDSIQSRVRSEGFGNIQTIWSDIERVGQTPIPEKSLDVCFFVNVLHMVQDRPNAFLEAARLLKPQGTLIVIDWSRPLGPLGPVGAAWVKPQDLIVLATKTNLTPLDEFEAGPYHFGMLFSKPL